MAESGVAESVAGNCLPMSTSHDATTNGGNGLVVIGGGPAGHSAAAAYRDNGGNGPVVIISADDHLPYQRPPLSKDYLRGESGEDDLPLEPASFYAEQRIDVWLGDPVVALSLDDRAVRTESGRTGNFDVCVLATGCEPAMLPVPGGNHPEVLRLRFLDQGRVLRRRAADARSAVVIGSGFIGCEAAASLAARGLDVTVIASDELPQLGRLGRSAAQRLAGWLTDAGVRLVGGTDIEAIESGTAVKTVDGRTFTADLVLSAAGVEPRGNLAAEAGLPTEGGRVLVDEQMRTADPRVFACGDVALARNAAAGRRLPVEHWGEALRMGEIAGANAAGGSVEWDDVPGFWSEIGGRTLKYHAWGDGFDGDDLDQHEDGSFTVWYSRDGAVVGVLTHNRDEDYERAADLITRGAPAPLVQSP